MVGLGEVESRLGSPGAVASLVDGARLLGRLEHTQGVAVAMLRLGEHGLRVEEAEIALIAGRSAWHLMRRSDPGRGSGQALRVVVKSFAAMRRWTEAVTAAYTRAAVAGHFQANAYDVRDFYRERAPRDLVESLDLLDRAALESQTMAHVDAVLAPLLQQMGASSAAAGAIPIILELLERVADRLPLIGQDDATEEVSATLPARSTPTVDSPLSVQALEQDEAPEDPEIPGEYAGLYEPLELLDEDDTDVMDDGYGGLYDAPPVDLSDE